MTFMYYGLFGQISYVGGMGGMERNGGRKSKPLIVIALTTAKQQ